MISRTVSILGKEQLIEAINEQEFERAVRNATRAARQQVEAAETLVQESAAEYVDIVVQGDPIVEQVDITLVVEEEPAKPVTKRGKKVSQAPAAD